MASSFCWGFVCCWFGCFCIFFVLWVGLFLFFLLLGLDFFVMGWGVCVLVLGGWFLGWLGWLGLVVCRLGRLFGVLWSFLASLISAAHVPFPPCIT
ncbi:hypothetical protein, partial [Pseudomonas syringae group genomosp. 7]|uniref:hypothetical protein n=1 Tax=Pseudomonas syringae group genomosp. 7 TaxID=251699 RepID=UPI0037705405